MKLKHWTRRAGIELPARVWHGRRRIVVVIIAMLAVADLGVLWALSDQPDGLSSAALALLLLCNALGMFAVGLL
ncbi:hypothetical protein AB4144_27050, partial [Rhizobiaceae sp. 2RAB30]